jgi:subtilisin family serine protease
MKKRIYAITMTIACSLVFFAHHGYAGQSAKQIRAAVSAERAKGELVVKVIGGANEPRKARNQILSALNQAIGQNAIRSISTFLSDAELYKVVLTRDADMMKALEALNSEEMIKYAEPNFVYHALDVAPNDTDFTKLWGLSNTGQKDESGQAGSPGSDIHVLPLWSQGVIGSRKVTVAVIDTGVDWNHPDLVKNLYTNTKEIPGNGIDDDNNGFIDDVHGWSFSSKSNNSADDHDHGTHCAGTIGAEGNNSLGVVGVNWEVSILPVKFLDATGGGTLADAIEAINYARKMKVQVMSNSWGGGSFSQALKDAIDETKKEGILFVAAAGNDSNNNDSHPSYPATYDSDNIISVAATDNLDQIAGFSNFGAKSVHVAAPGVKIFSTIRDGKYGAKSGTSMATPHVAGIAALLWAALPDLTYADIKSRLIKTSVPVSGLKKKVAAKGRVDAYNAFHNIVPPSTDPDESLWKTVEKAFESEHPYKNGVDLKFEVKHPGAKYLRVIFDKIETENSYDTLAIENSSGAAVDTISGTFENYTTEYVLGDTLTIHFKTDSSVTKWGFGVSKIQFIE